MGIPRFARAAGAARLPRALSANGARAALALASAGADDGDFRRRVRARRGHPDGRHSRAALLFVRAAGLELLRAKPDHGQRHLRQQRDAFLESLVPPAGRAGGDHRLESGRVRAATRAVFSLPRVLRFPRAGRGHGVFVAHVFDAAAGAAHRGAEPRDRPVDGRGDGALPRSHPPQSISRAALDVRDADHLSALARAREMGVAHLGEPDVGAGGKSALVPARARHLRAGDGRAVGGRDARAAGQRRGGV